MTERPVPTALHTHSSLSDGTLAPAELAARLADRGAGWASLTDHDTTAGSVRFREALARRGVGCIDGVELTVATESGEAHLLAYGADPAHPALVGLLPSSRLPDRRGDGRTGPRANGAPAISAAIAAVHAAGGAAFLAHPLHLEPDPVALGRLLDALVPLGLDGIEAMYAGYDEARVALLLDLADRRELAASAGGDFHEPGVRGQPDVVAMPEPRWKAFRDVLVRRSTETRRQPAAEGPDVVDPAPPRDGRDPGGMDRSDRRIGTRIPARAALGIVLPAIVTMILFVASSFAITIPRVEAMMLGRKKEMIRELTDSAISILAEYEKAARGGSMDEGRARKEAADRIRDLRYGKDNKDYFWVTDMTPRMIVHPYRRELEGTDVSGFRDGNGLRVFVEFVHAVADAAEGYVEYSWQWKDDANRVAPKLSFVRRYAPWDWVIGTGVYLEDVRAEIDSLTADLVVLDLCVTAILALAISLMVRRGFRVERGRLLAEAALKESRERYRALAEGATDGTAIVVEGSCAFANGAFLSMAGYEEREIQLFRADELFEPHPGEEAFDDRSFSSSPDGGLSDGASIECRLARRSGERLDVRVSGIPFALGGREGAVLSVKEANPRGIGASSPVTDGNIPDATEVIREKRRLERILERTEAAALWMTNPVSTIASAPPTCRSADPIREAAARMRGANSAAVIVEDESGNAIGIVTAGDVSARATASGVDPGAAVGTIMSAPIVSVLPSATVSDAMAAMRESRVGTVALRDGTGAIRGLAGASDIAKLAGGTFATIRDAALKAESPGELEDLVDEAFANVGASFSAGTRARVVLGSLSGVQDAVAASVARLAAERLGPAPADWVFMALGSMGRGERLPGSDQDNALAWKHEDGDPGRERAYFASLGQAICDGLELAGFPRCPGGVMASSDEWNRPISEWEKRIAQDISEPEPDRMLNLHILFDFRAVAGSPAIAESLRDTAYSIVGGEPGFFIHLARDARLRKTPGSTARARQGVDLKEASAAITAFARVYALKHGVRATSTFDRLDALAESGAIRPDTRDNVADAHDSLMAMRLEHAYDRLRRGDRVPPRPLSAREEALLGFARAQAALLQQRIGFDFLGSAL
ncbi:MAG: cache domain-containing protein [Spirochaetes bacterium]|nr:cache domain-containing protein [Spirochaetota bacterium]